MKDAQPRAIRRADYQPPAYLIERTNLRFELGSGTTRVTSRLTVRRNPAGEGGALVLDGQALTLESVALDGEALSENAFAVDDESLTLFDVPEHFELEVVTGICPEENTALEGLYRSGGMYCTQCEAEGFRRITYYLDRPDVLSRFTTTLVGDGAELPIMLSNGNEVARERLADGRTAVTWEDPFPKPAYLFALVAGTLEHIESTFVTMSGREVLLRIYTEPHNVDKVDYAMDALKRSMRWDEEVYGREYDLDIFMIVAVDDFNMGAMENKGLNIFNTSCVLASPETTTDAGYQRVEAVVAHEYFHNWSGNRVTCRDWFQLSLKEGFTVLRDAQFSADMNAATIKRIEDANFLRTMQFAEDAGPMAHPIRPDSFIEISNFYTLTVYEKGAEVVRMIRTLLGPERFRAGTDLYFERHDGQAVTCDDFVIAMEDASDVDLGQFRNWYSQAGTPRVRVESSYDADAQALTLEFEQSCPPSPGQSEKAPFVIPFAVGALDAAGNELLGAAGPQAVTVACDARIDNPLSDGTLVVQLAESRTSLRIEGVDQPPALSLHRDFSAPVIVEAEPSLESLAFLVAHDSDGFARWDAAQAFYSRLLLKRVTSESDETPSLLFETVDALVTEALEAPENSEARALAAAMLTLPSEEYLAQQMSVVDVEGIHAARSGMRHELAERFSGQWRRLFQANASQGAYVPDARGFARRALGALALAYWAECEDGEGLDAARALYERADNMTERLAALRTIAWHPGAADRNEVLDNFLVRFRSEALVVDQWFATQALRASPDVIEDVRRLEGHEAFDARNPNKLRSLIGAFCNQNPIGFHAPGGEGYRYLADWVIRLNTQNPQMAARLLTPLTRWRRFDAPRQERMRAALQRIGSTDGLSKDVFEVVSKSLADS